MRGDGKKKMMLENLQRKINWVLVQPNFDAATDRVIEEISKMGIDFSLVVGNFREKLSGSYTYVRVSDIENYDDDFHYGGFLVEESLAGKLRDYIIKQSHYFYNHDSLADQYSEFDFIKEKVESQKRFKNVVYVSEEEVKI